MRVTNTNSGEDSKGLVRIGSWTLEGSSYLYLVVGTVAGMLLFILCWQVGMILRFCIASAPLLGAIAWVKHFVMGRPPHYQGDYFERLLTGRSFRLAPHDWAKAAHPRGNRVRST